MARVAVYMGDVQDVRWRRWMRMYGVRVTPEKWVPLFRPSVVLKALAVVPGPLTTLGWTSGPLSL